MTSDQLSETALFFEEKADQYREAGYPELAEKFRQASRATLDAAFPFYEGDKERATVILQGIERWLEEFDRRRENGA